MAREETKFKVVMYVSIFSDEKGAYSIIPGVFDAN